MDYSDEELGNQAAFPVEEGDEDFDLDIPPTTGNEYLRRVRHEAKNYRTVVKADIDTSKYNQKQTFRLQVENHVPAPAGLWPARKFQEAQMADFAEVRQKLLRYKEILKKQKRSKLPELPEATDAESWCRLCFGHLQVASATPSEGSADPPASPPTSLQPEGASQGTPPHLSIVARMDQARVISVLEYHVNWLEATGFTSLQGQWFFALLAKLEKPLMPEACATIRNLARICSRLRALLENPDDPRLSEMNLLICIVARYFGQADLADD